MLPIKREPRILTKDGKRVTYYEPVQNPVSALVFLSYQPDLTGYEGAPIAAVLAEVGGKKYDQIHILDLIEWSKHNRLEVCVDLLKIFARRRYASVNADIETLRWLNSDQLFDDIAYKQQQENQWDTYPECRAVNRYQLKGTTNAQAIATAWQATVLDQVESMRDSEGQPVLRYVSRLKNNPSIMQKFSLRGRSTGVDGLAGAVWCALQIIPDLQAHYLSHTPINI